MGGVDAFDSYIALYRSRIQSNKRFCFKIFFHFLDAAVVNSWLEYRRACEDTELPKKDWVTLWDFKLEIAETVTRKNVLAKRRTFSSVQCEFLDKKRKGNVENLRPEEVRRDGIDHLPKTASNRGKCKLPGCTSQIKTICVKCNLHLCVSEKSCFLIFTQIKLEYSIQCVFYKPD